MKPECRVSSRAQCGWFHGWFHGWCGLLLLSCQSLPQSAETHDIKLYSRGVDHSEIGTLRLRYDYPGLNSPDNYFFAQLFTTPRPFEQIQIPRSREISPEQDAASPRYSPRTGSSYLKLQIIVPEAVFEGPLVYRFRSRQPFRHYDSRSIEQLLLISYPDSLDNIFSVAFSLFPSRKAYLLRTDLRPAQDFFHRIPPGTPVDQVADILSGSEQEAIFHNQTVVSPPRFRRDYY